MTWKRAARMIERPVFFQRRIPSLSDSAQMHLRDSLFWS